MATDTTIDPAITPTSTEGEPKKVTYTEEQQAHLQTLIDAAVGRSSRTAREEAAAVRTENARLAAELAAAKAAATAPKTGTTEEQTISRDEIERVKQQSQAALDAANAEIAASKRDAVKAKQEAQSIRTEVAITSAASKVPFVDIGVVLKLTKDNVKLDPETGRFTVFNENGQPKLNASFEPMTLDEFYTDFAAKNKYLVRGNVLAGTGSTESNRSTLSSNGRFEVAEIFGPKSSSAKASELMKNDPAEYKRMRAIAKTAGLVV